MVSQEHDRKLTQRLENGEETLKSLNNIRKVNYDSGDYDEDPSEVEYWNSFQVFPSENATKEDAMTKIEDTPQEKITFTINNANNHEFLWVTVRSKIEK